MPPTIPKGKVLRNRYRIHRLLHQSRHANIYLVEDKHLPGNVWAVREMQLYAVDNFEKNRIISQFSTEGQVLSGLSHPNLAKVVDFFAEGNNLYIVREYVHGTDLAQVLSSRTTPLGERDALQALSQLLDAVIYLWGRKLPAIFFRELNAQNIIFCKGNEIKLLDLGLASVFQPSSDADVMRRVGSLDYASPEQFSDSGTFDQRSLVYSLGSIFYHMLTLRSPASSPFALEPVETLNSNLSPATEDIVNHATENEPRDRFPSLADMKKSLQAVIKAPQAVPATPRGWKPKEASPPVLDEPQSEEEEEEDPTDAPIWNWALAVFLLAVMSGALLAIYYYFFRGG